MNVPDPNDLPLGAILPFPPGEVPEGWEVFDGRFLGNDLYDDLYDVISTAPKQVRNLWRALGGGVKMHGLILPGPTHAEATAMVFGSNAHPEIDFVLAIRAKRTGNG